jgi:hypothetical protein
VVESTLAADTRVITIGLHPRVIDYSAMPDGVDETSLTERIERGNAALREAGFDVALCQVDTAPDAAEEQVRTQLRGRQFGLALIGGGIRMIPEHTELFERIVNVLLEVSPGIRLCFNTAPDNSIDALRRWIAPPVTG